MQLRCVLRVSNFKGARLIPAKSQDECAKAEHLSSDSSAISTGGDCVRTEHVHLALRAVSNSMHDLVVGSLDLKILAAKAAHRFARSHARQ